MLWRRNLSLALLSFVAEWINIPERKQSRSLRSWRQTCVIIGVPTQRLPFAGDRPCKDPRPAQPGAGREKEEKL